MAMNNIYYRSIHLLSNKEYGKLPARLRMNIIGNPGVEKLDFELWSLAVSAINGCGMCLDSHEREVIGKGASKEGVQDALRIASVLHAAAAVIDGEKALPESQRAAVAPASYEGLRPIRSLLAPIGRDPSYLSGSAFSAAPDLFDVRTFRRAAQVVGGRRIAPGGIVFKILQLA